MTRFLLLLLLAASVVALVPACSSIDQYVPPVYDVRGKRVFVVPFRYGNYWHYESKEGNRLGQSLEVALQSDCGGLETMRDRPVQDLIRKDLSDQVDWLAYGRRLQVDYLIVGEIDELGYENPGFVGMFQGRVRARYEVWNIRAGDRGYVREVEVRVPEDPEAGEVYISFEQSKDEIETALLAEAGRRIAGHLCGYEQKGLPK
jgi:hypothetical protein